MAQVLRDLLERWIQLEGKSMAEVLDVFALEQFPTGRGDAKVGVETPARIDGGGFTVGQGFHGCGKRIKLREVSERKYHPGGARGVRRN